MKSRKIFVSIILCLVFGIGLNLNVTKSSTVNHQLILLVYNSRDLYGTSVYQNVLFTLQKNGIDSISWDLNRYENLPLLSSYPIVGLVTEQLYQMNRNTVLDIKEYVNHGGKLIQFIRGYSEDMAELFGMDKEYMPTDITIRGLQFLHSFFPGSINIHLDSESLSDDGMNYAYLKSIRPIATSEDNIPVLWENSFGSGRTLFWNCTALNTKAFRGFIIASVTRFMEISVRKVIGKSVIFVDDFPSSSWNAKLEPTFSELGVTDTGFYSKVLLKDLEKLAKDFFIRYSTVAVFNYNNQKVPPFGFTDWDNCNVVEDSNSVNVPGQMFHYLLAHPDTFSVGLHGYNHIQLTKDQWESPAMMQESLASAREKWFQYSKKPPTFYVPPMNEIDEDGFKSLNQIFPEINSVGSLYESEAKLGCNREFGNDPWNPSIVSIPRETSGYYLNSYDQMLACSTMEAFGIWTHFIHPDDIYSNPTNYPTLPIEWIRNPENLSWYGNATGQNGLFYRLKDVFESMQTNFPWIEYDFVPNVRTHVKNYAEDTSCPIVTQNQIIFSNQSPIRYLIELPEAYTFSLSDSIKILTKETIDHRTKYLAEVATGTTVNIIPK